MRLIRRVIEISIFLVISFSVDTVAISTWKETAIEFPSGENLNTRISNSSLIINNEPLQLGNWIQTNSTASPSSRYQHSMINNKDRGVYILFGGRLCEGSRSDIWVYNMSLRRWTLMPAQNNRPPDRAGQAMIYDSNNHNIIMCGGRHDYIDIDLWIYDLDTNSWQEKYPLVKPPSRSLHSIVYDPVNSRIILFGGRHQDNSTTYSFLNDTWTYYINTNTWSNNTPINSPSKRYGQAMCYDSSSGQILLFGGTDDNTFFQDTWIYTISTNTWAECNTSFSPAPRSGAVMIADPIDRSIILYGGHDGYNIYNDIWSYNISDKIWTNRNLTQGPSPRSYATMTDDSKDDNLFLFGGIGSDGILLDDYWIYNTTNNSWLKLGSQTAPSPRGDFSITFDNGNNSGFLFGGTDSYGRYNDTWLYNASNNSWIKKNPKISPSPRAGASICFNSHRGLILLFGGEDSRRKFNDTWIYNLSSENWTKMRPTVSPISKTGCTIASKPSDDEVILFGGIGSGMENGTWPYFVNNETWAYNFNLDIWINRTKTVTPPPRYGAGMVYNEANGSFILFGGTDDNRFYGDTWKFNSTSLVWSLVSTGLSPRGRVFPAMTYIASKSAIFLFGGGTYYDPYYNDTWIFFVYNETWMELSPINSPAPSMGPGLFYNSVNGFVMLFGGFANDTRYCIQDNWIYNISQDALYGIYTSIPKELGENAFFGRIGWEATKPKGTDLKLQIRTGITRNDMESKEFTGPDGSKNSYFIYSGQLIPSINNNTAWMQYRAYLSSDNIFTSPTLSSVSIRFNLRHNLTIISPITREEWAGIQNITWSAYDKDNDTLTFDIFLENETDSVPLAMGLSNERRRLEWNTNTTQDGIYRIRIIAHDENPYIPLVICATSGSFSIFQSHLPNHPPHVSLLSPLNNSFVNDTTVQLTWNGTDFDNDSLIYTCRYDTNPQMEGANSIHFITNQSVYLTNLSENTTYYWTVDATDGKVNDTYVPTEIWSFTVKLPKINHPPKITSNPPSVIQEGDNYDYYITVVDEDNDIINISIVQAPINLSFNSSTGRIHWVPTTTDIGNHNFTIRALDNNGGMDDQAFTVTVIPRPPQERPRCTITSPVNGSTIDGLIQIRGNAIKGSNPLSTIQINIDGSQWLNATGLETWSYTYDVSKLKNGNHRIEARAFDGFLFSNQTSIIINVQNPEPNVRVEQAAWWAPIAIIIAIVIVAVFLLRRKKSGS
jgi:N-acetylneuraminic acid mutarotase